ncbi:MAG TPA: hypothetical protein VN131_06155, partial [Mobilitalea sp.]|nr:hypothetical protein [Mobilitalea sp.]
DDRNSILTVRNGLTFLVGIIISLGCGRVLASAKSIGDKIRIHQCYLWIAVILLILQIIVLRKIKNSEEHAPSGISFRELKAALIELRHNKKFLGFVSVALFFYLTWQIDWTLYFLGQTKYLGFNEAWLSYKYR